MRVGLIGQTRRRWAPRGVKIVQLLEYQHKWMYLNLAVHCLTGQIHWEWTEDMKGVSIAPVVKRWHEKGVSTIVWDRASGHRGLAYDDIQTNLIEQPPYSPELNPAERVFEYLRDKVEGKVYGTIEAKQDAVDTALQNLSANLDQVKSLVSWSWIRSAVIDLPSTVLC